MNWILCTLENILFCVMAFLMLVAIFVLVSLPLLAVAECRANSKPAINYHRCFIIEDATRTI